MMAEKLQFINMYDFPDEFLQIYNHNFNAFSLT